MNVSTLTSRQDIPFVRIAKSRQLETSSSGEYAGNYRKRLGAADAAETLS